MTTATRTQQPWEGPNGHLWLRDLVALLGEQRTVKHRGVQGGGRVWMVGPQGQVERDTNIRA